MKKKWIILVLITVAIVSMSTGAQAKNRTFMPLLSEWDLNKIIKYFPKNEDTLERLSGSKIIPKNSQEQVKIFQAASKIFRIVKTQGEYYGYVNIAIGNCSLYLYFKSYEDAQEFLHILYTDGDFERIGKIEKMNNFLRTWMKEEILGENQREEKGGKKIFKTLLNLSWFKYRYAAYCRQHWISQFEDKTESLNEKLEFLVAYKIYSTACLAEELTINSANKNNPFIIRINGIKGEGKNIRYFLEVKNRAQQALIVYKINKTGRISFVHLEEAEREDFINKAFQAALAKIKK